MGDNDRSVSDQTSSRENAEKDDKISMSSSTHSDLPTVHAPERTVSELALLSDKLNGKLNEESEPVAETQPSDVANNSESSTDNALSGDDVRSKSSGFVGNGTEMSTSGVAGTDRRNVGLRPADGSTGIASYGQPPTSASSMMPPVVAEAETRQKSSALTGPPVVRHFPVSQVPSASIDADNNSTAVPASAATVVPEVPHPAAFSTVSNTSAPPYTVNNPYIYEHPAAANQPVYYDSFRPGRAESHASERASNSSKSSAARGLGQSFKSLLRKSSDHKQDGSSTRSHRTSKSRQTDEELAEEYAKKMEDPHHLLSTILEDDNEDKNEKLVTLQDAAEEVNAENPDAPPVRRRGYRANLVRHGRILRYTQTSKAIHWFHNKYLALAKSSMLMRVFVVWLPLAIILFVPLACGAWQNTNLEVGRTRIMWIFIWLEVSWGTLCFGKIFAHYVPEIFGFIVSIFIPRYLKFVDMFVALEFAIQMLIWTFVTFITFSPLIYDSEATKGSQPGWKKVVQNICVALLVSAIVFMIEQIFLYFLSTNFHKTRMAMRIQHQKKSKHVLIILLDLAYTIFPYDCDEFYEEDEFLKFANVKMAESKVGTMSTNKYFQNVTNFVGSAARNMGNVVSDVRDPSGKNVGAAKTVKEALIRRTTREVLANRIWKSLVLEDSTALTYNDLLEMFGPSRKEEVMYMMDILGSPGSEEIELSDMVESVNRIGREGKQISRSLIDIDGAITKLHYVLLFICTILIIMVFVGMLAPSASSVLATLGSTMLSFSFLFSSSAQEVFVSCIFVFVKHPYDIGDWVQLTVPSVGLVRMQVLQLNLTYSVFVECGVNTRRQVAHQTLNSSFIDNITRSPPSNLNVTLNIGVPETTNEQLGEFEQRLLKYTEDNPREFGPSVYFQLTDHPDLDRMTLTICITTRNNQDDLVLYATRKSRALEYIGQWIREIPITIPRRDDNTYTDPSLPMYHYNIKDIDQAMDYSRKAHGKRPKYGFMPPKIGGFVPLGQEKTETDESESESPETEVVKPTIRKQPSFASRYSRNSAFSSVSRSNLETGLRSRRFSRQGSIQSVRVPQNTQSTASEVPSSN